jgi:hypothetical protein
MLRRQSRRQGSADLSPEKRRDIVGRLQIRGQRYIAETGASRCGTGCAAFAGSSHRRPAGSGHATACGGPSSLSRATGGHAAHQPETGHRRKTAGAESRQTCANQASIAKTGGAASANS